MANEIRLRANNIAGSITDNPLTAGSTNINSPGFVDLPVVDPTNHLILILDPLEANGAAEIVRVTSHLAANSTITVVRGAENSTPRQHPLGTTWFHGPVTSDWEETLTSGTRPAVPYTGEALYERDTLRTMRYNGTAWVQDGLLWDPPACRIQSTVAQAVTSGGTTVLNFTTERFDTDNMHDNGVNPNRITFTTAGLYAVGFSYLLDSRADYNYTFGNIRLNGATTISTVQTSDQDTALTAGSSANTIYKFAAGEWIDFQISQTNAAAASVNTLIAAAFNEAWACWIGRGN